MTKNLNKTVVLAFALSALAACGGETAEVPASVEQAKVSEAVKPAPANDAEFSVATKPGAPYSVGYRIIGTPIVGSPLIIDLQVSSTLGPGAANLAYRINDSSSMLLAESQPAQVSLDAAADEVAMHEQVSVVPLREGRLYLNVEVAHETANGTVATVTAIPIQVGDAARQLQDHGRIETDSEGETIRVLDGN